MPALGHAQAVQVPIAIMSTIGNVTLNDVTIDYVLGGVVAATSVVGVVIGATAAHKLPRATLKNMVTVVLAIAGCVLIGKVVWQREN